MVSSGSKRDHGPDAAPIDCRVGGFALGGTLGSRDKPATRVLLRPLEEILCGAGATRFNRSPGDRGIRTDPPRSIKTRGATIGHGQCALFWRAAMFVRDKSLVKPTPRRRVRSETVLLRMTWQPHSSKISGSIPRPNTMPTLDGRSHWSGMGRRYPACLLRKFKGHLSDQDSLEQDASYWLRVGQQSTNGQWVDRDGGTKRWLSGYYCFTV